jgi:glycosyltransferase involved in cell wall biosynthesis
LLNWFTKHPEFHLSIAGIDTPKNYSIPDNVIFHGSVPISELKQLYNSSQFYLQLSAFEGFGMSLCEAMLCGCTPIVSNVNILPFIVGNTGLVIRKRKLEAMENILTKIRTYGVQPNYAARDRVSTLFSVNKRLNRLKEVIENT